MQNAEELLKHASVRIGIDAIAKEDLYYGVDHTGILGVWDLTALGK